MKRPLPKNLAEWKKLYLPDPEEMARLSKQGVDELMANMKRDVRVPTPEQLQHQRFATTTRVAELRRMSYKEYLETPEWKERRKRSLKKAGYRCQLCNMQGGLNVHHRTYERRGNEKDTDLIALCRDCHSKFHDKLPT